jgi:hypothetical protein
MSTPVTAPSGFTLRVPDSWYEFDVWRATRTGDLARRLDARIAETPGLARYRRPLLKMLREAGREADRQGALFCAVMLEPVEDAGRLVATAMVFQTDGAPDRRENTVDTIAGQVSAQAPAEGSPAWRQVEVVEIPAGRAVRLRGVDAADPDLGRPDGVVMQTLLPIPDDGGVVNVVLTSPQVSLAEPMLELFAAISDTFAWTTDPAGGGGRLEG